MAATISRVCEFCGKTIRPLMVPSFGGGQMVVGWEECDCEKSREASSEREKREHLEKIEEERIEREKVYLRAGIPPRYLDARSERRHESLYIYGPVGVGKTYVASAMALQAIGEGMRVRMVSSVDLLSEIRGTYNRDSYVSEDDISERYGCCELLVLDDLGKERPTEWALQTLYRIVDMRYSSMRETIVTSNHSRSGLIQRLGESETAIAMVSRLAEMCKGLHMEGDDRRLGQDNSF